MASIVEAIKTKMIIKDDLYGPDVNAALEKVSLGKALFMVVLPIHEKFCRKQNQDKLLEEFYWLLPITRSTFLHYTDATVANLIIDEISDHLVGFFKIAQFREGAKNNLTKTSSSATDFELDPSEQGPLSYITGYIVSKIYQKSRSKREASDKELHALVNSPKSIDMQTTSFRLEAEEAL